MDSIEYVRKLAGKLPVPLKQKWINQVGIIRDVEYRNPTLEDLTRFVKRLAKNQNDPRVKGLGYRRSSTSTSRDRNDKPMQKTAKVFGTQATNQDS